MIDKYDEIIASFTSHLEHKDNIRCIILDGSVNNHEHIHGLSDIDLKIFVIGDSIHVETFDAIQRAIQFSLQGNEIIFNAWSLLEEEYPRSRTNSVFDFVRKYCLLKGTIIYNNHFVAGDIDILKIGEVERRDCLRAVFNFQIRLRRLLTNGLAITDVKALSSDFLLQQSIAYLFHSVRYFNAYYGIVCCKIADVANTFLRMSDCDSDSHFIKEMYSLRQNWDCRPQSLLAGKEVLLHTTSFIDRLSTKMRTTFSDDFIPVQYI